MAKICYVPKRFKAASLAIIETANRVITEMRAQGYRLTLRQLYYQFVGHDLFPADMKWRWTGTKWVRDANGTINAEPNYKLLGSVLNDGRLAGLIDWEAIEDRTRELKRLSHWSNPKDIVDACAKQYRRDKWAPQDNYVEVWIEKDALEGIVEGVCNRFQVPFFSCRGYTSQSALWEAAMRLEERAQDGKNCVVIHLGDHDPSGIDMSRDILDRFNIFTSDSNIEVRRIALNMDQVRKYNPPPNPAKQTDARFKGYAAEHGDESWELDALEPKVIDSLIEDNILELRDEALWKQECGHETEERKQIAAAAKTIVVNEH